jgi:mono/diheme cytochrome c family protein
LIMPSQNYRYLSDDDLGAIIAYIRSLPAIDRTSPEPNLTLIGTTLFGLGGLGRLPAEIIEHDAPRPEAPAPGVTTEYGGYLVNIATCKDCHSQNLAGGQVAPGEPYAPNLTPGGELGGWAEEDFIHLIRTGQTPTGRQISGAMPWEEHYQFMTDEELQAIWAYLSSLEPLPGNDS